MKHYILSAVALLSTLGMNAQVKHTPTAQKSKVYVKPRFAPMMEQDKFLSVSFGGGISTLLYDFSYGESEWGKGGRANIDYNIFFNRLCGISFGVGGSKLNSSVNFDLSSKYTTTIPLDITNAYNVTNPYDTECTTTFYGWKEKHSMLALEVPVGALFRVPIKQKMTFLAGSGAKFSFPIKSKYEVTDGKLAVSLYNKDLNLTIDSVPSHGVTTSDKHFAGDTKTKFVAANLFVDLNMVHKVGAIHLFYGLYADYGLTSIAKRDESLTSIIDYNGVMISDAVKKINPFSVGFRIGAKIPCPKLKDQDRDGVIDIKDNCPDTPAGLPVDNCGCPLDTDGDGVYDYLDRCGDTPNGVVVDTCGCPLDSDDDGVPDYLDKCPYTPKNTPVDNHGCPFDADGDGVADYADKCPNTPDGVKVDQNGCPNDTDGDGIPDYLDKCPTIPGIEANEGCPDVDENARRVFKAAEHGIEFEPGTANMRKSSYAHIEKIVQIMREYPNYRLVVNGHTDASGSMGVNLKISKRRAMVIVDYMVERGIYPTRLKSFGHGGTQPIADDKTATGRKLNNRIEFRVEFEQ